MISYAAALAYYAIFALPPLLLIILTSTKQLYFWGSSEVYIFDEIQALIGTEATNLLRQSMQKIATFDGGMWGIVISIAIIIFSSTSVFAVIQVSFNKIFNVKADPTVWKGIWLYLFRRVISLGLLIGFAFILVVSLIFNMAIHLFSDYLFGSTLSVALTDFMGSIVIPGIILTLFFALMLRFLPDVKIKFKHVWPGAIFTAVLFMIGKYAIGTYVGNSSFSNAYASASSLIVVLLWSYYSSILVLLGCAFLKSHMDRKEISIEPYPYAKQ